MPLYLVFTCITLMVIGAVKITAGLLRMAFYTLQLLWVTRIVSFPVMVLAGVWLVAIVARGP